MKKNEIIKIILIIFFIRFSATFCWGGVRGFVEIKRFNAKEARQGVAVDEKFIYVISNRQIGKYDKKTYRFVGDWVGEEDGPIIHLNSGAVIDGKLYCAHSNYPGIPMTSSVEIFDPQTLKHIGSHSFGIQWGSCIWVDYYENYWWVAFAHYDKWKLETGKGSEWTTVVKYDDQWRYLEAWVFPDDVMQRFRPMSNSGASWGPDGLLYCAGHNLPELFAFRLPEAGSKLELVEVIPITNLGQGIAWDRSNSGVIYSIRKKDRQVVVSRLSDMK